MKLVLKLSQGMKQNVEIQKMEINSASKSSNCTLDIGNPLKKLKVEIFPVGALASF